MNISLKNLAIIASLSMLGLSRSVLAETQIFPFGHPGTVAKVHRTGKVTALDTMRFIPDLIHVQAGETVRFIVTNKGQVVHEFILGDHQEQIEHEKAMQNMKSIVMPDEANGITIRPTQTKLLIWTFGSAGEVEFACHQPGHYVAGMVGKISVKPIDPR